MFVSAPGEKFILQLPSGTNLKYEGIGHPLISKP